MFLSLALSLFLHTSVHVQLKSRFLKDTKTSRRLSYLILSCPILYGEDKLIAWSSRRAVCRHHKVGHIMLYLILIEPNLTYPILSYPKPNKQSKCSQSGQLVPFLIKKQEESSYYHSHNHITHIIILLILSYYSHYHITHTIILLILSHYL